jgi:hypothetical protein
MGHHADAKSGLEPLDEVAQIMSSLAHPIWMDMKAIARSNFLSRIEGELLIVKMYSRRIALRIPDGMRGVTVERPWMHNVSSEERVIVKGIASGSISEIAGRITRCFSVEGCEDIEIASVANEALDFQEIPSPAVSAWPIARRLLTEFRDRTLPLMQRGARIFGLA